MARVKFEYRHEDPAGNIAIRTKATLLVPGTSTPVTGLWDAETGGTALTQPINANGKGEIIAWLDSPQDVELRVLDDTDFPLHADDDRPFIPAGLMKGTSRTYETQANVAQRQALQAQVVTGPSSSPVEDVMASWWSLARAKYLGSFWNRTYFTGVGRSGDVVVGHIDHTSGTTRRQVIGKTTPDDHNTPAILAELDLPLLVAYTDHDEDAIVRVVRGSAMTSAVTSGVLVDPTYTEVTFPTTVSYVQVYRQITTSNVLMLTRGTDRYWYAAWSSDGGLTWGAPVTIFDFGADGKGYVASVQLSSGTVRLALYGHPTIGTFGKSIYYGNINMTTGEVRNQAGTIVGNTKTGASLPVVVKDSMTLIYTPATGKSVRLFDLSPSTVNEIAFAEWSTDTDTMYRYLYYDGSAWVARDVVAAGVVFGYTPSSHYNGGMSIPNPSAQGAGRTLYLAREAAGTWTVEKATTADLGVTWTRTVVATSTGTRKLVRPYCPMHAPASGAASVIYHDLRQYNGFEDFYADLRFAA